MKKFPYLLPGLLLAALGCDNALGHAEEEKPRYVSAEGIDSGRCDNMFRPCRTIRYAASQAGKGDRILVAQGNYFIESAEDVFYL
ncbi:MAG: hypothetical protein MJA83_13375, partial [Gammaproteobacteria bacterium]|nr:hypothetical protein [Gammaproteobacteria bacterium]